MREINECTAEVFRRSEKRIKERKRNRNRILAFCIPLCLIVTVWSIMILPAIMPANKSNNAAGEGMDMAGSVDGTAAAYVRVEVMSTGTATQSTILKDDADEVAQIEAVKAQMEAAGAEIYLVENPVTAISSTQLRRMLVFRCAEEFLPEAVERYI